MRFILPKKAIEDLEAEKDSLLLYGSYGLYRV